MNIRYEHMVDEDFVRLRRYSDDGGREVLWRVDIGDPGYGERAIHVASWSTGAFSDLRDFLADIADLDSIGPANVVAFCQIFGFKRWTNFEQGDGKPGIRVPE